MLKNLKSLFIVSEENVPDAAPSAGTGTPQAAPVAQSHPEQKATGTTHIDENILNKLLKAFEENNQPGFDYLEFRQSLKAMSHLALDESTKFQTAFATASAIGATQENLIGSIHFYQKVLKSEEEKFVKATDDQTRKSIDSKKAEQDSLTKAIAEKSAIIQRLSSEIHEHQQKINEIASYVVDTERKIIEMETKFNTTLQFVYKQLEDDVIKLKTYIK